MFSKRNPQNPQTPRTIRTARNTPGARSLTALNNAPEQNLVAATIKDAERLETYALILDGNALAPKYCDGDLLTIRSNALPPLPGDVVVARIGSRHACMFVNADGDLWDNNRGFVPRGFFTVVGIVMDRTPMESTESPESPDARG